MNSNLTNKVKNAIIKVYRHFLIHKIKKGGLFVPKEFLSAKDEKRIISLLQSSLDNSKSIPEALDNFSEALIVDYKLLANSIDEYCELIKNRKYLNALRKTFNLVYDFISKMSVEETGANLMFKIEGRRKGVINTVEKMLRLLKDGRSLDLLRDLMGIRIILFGDETDLLQNQCYLVMQEIIDFMLERHFTLCEADKIETNVKLNDSVNILIPKQSLISPFYQTGIKDYILNPKANGYQSIHAVFRARNTSCIEIQVRTEQMHLNAQFIHAEHELYKNGKYGERLQNYIDFSKIHMPGFRYLGDTIYDDIGLQTSLLTFYRTYLF